MLERIRDTLRGARHIELIVLIVLIALIGLVFLNRMDVSVDADKTPVESRLEDILSHLDGVKSPAVMVSESSDGDILGVVVIAQGAESIQNRLNIENTIRTLLNIDTTNIEIINRNKGGISG